MLEGVFINFLKEAGPEVFMNVKADLANLVAKLQNLLVALFPVLRYLRFLW